MDSQSSSSQQPVDNSPHARLGRKLREARKAAGYSSHQALATAMNCDRSTITKVESGKLLPSQKILRLWCELCPVGGEPYEPMARLARAPEGTPLPLRVEDFASAQPP